MIMSAAPAAKVPAALKMLVRYSPMLGIFINTPESEVSRGAVSTSLRETVARTRIGESEAADETQQHQQQPRIRDFDKGADHRDGKRDPTHDLVWIHCLPPSVTSLWTRPCQPGAAAGILHAAGAA